MATRVQRRTGQVVLASLLGAAIAYLGTLVLLGSDHDWALVLTIALMAGTTEAARGS